MKKFLFAASLLITLTLILTLTSCGNNQAEIAIPVGFYDMGLIIELSDTNPVIARTTGYTTTTQLSNRVYFFRDGDETASEFVNTTEAIIRQLSNYMDIPYARLRIHSSPYDYTFTNIEVSLNFESGDTFGWLTNQLSRGRLPLWLSTGLEAYAKSQLGIFTPTNQNFATDTHFSDLAFMPSMWRTNERANAIDMAYHFTSHLAEFGLLAELVALYQDDENRQANYKAAQHFYNHFGWSMNTPVAIMAVNLPNGTIAATSGEDTITFSFDDFNSAIPMTAIINYVEYTRNAIDFTVGFMAQFVEFEVMPLQVKVYYDGRALFDFFGGGAGDSFIIVTGAESMMTIAHEVVHVVARWIYAQHGVRPIQPLEEGFASYIMAVFNKSENFDHQLFYIDHYSDRGDLRTSWTIFYDHDYHFMAQYRLINMDYYNMGHFVHQSRYTAVGSPYHIPAINTYEPATSFVIYLINTYGIDNFMEALWNIENFHYIYGKDIHGMIEGWREFLSDFVAGHRHSLQWENRAGRLWLHTWSPWQ
ncbi:MAG: hypothetical protein FWE21_05650 [Defluviitaleaceae bacterium]|nr:hypothetical protein [Defluviitaleaceae bacterium]